MGRNSPFKMVRLDQEIYDRLKKKKIRELRRDDMTQYIEYLLDRLGRDLYVDVELYNNALHEIAVLKGGADAGGNVHAVRVRKGSTDEQRKTG